MRTRMRMKIYWISADTLLTEPVGLRQTSKFELTQIVIRTSMFVEELVVLGPNDLIEGREALLALVLRYIISCFDELKPGNLVHAWPIYLCTLVVRRPTRRSARHQGTSCGYSPPEKVLDYCTDRWRNCRTSMRLLGQRNHHLCHQGAHKFVLGSRKIPYTINTIVVQCIYIRPRGPAIRLMTREDRWLTIISNS